jgi:hypothetical protein
VWFKIVAPSNGALQFNSTLAWSHKIMVFYGSELKDLVSLSSIYAGSTQPQIVGPVYAGTTYYVSLVSCNLPERGLTGFPNMAPQSYTLAYEVLTTYNGGVVEGDGSPVFVPGTGNNGNGGSASGTLTASMGMLLVSIMAAMLFVILN